MYVSKSPERYSLGPYNISYCQFIAHKVILNQIRLLKYNKCLHPLIYMNGIKAKDLVSIIDFIYYGETNICQEDLNGFLNFAEEIQLKGLVGTKTAKEEIINTIDYNHDVDSNLL